MKESLIDINSHVYEGDEISAKMVYVRNNIYIEDHDRLVVRVGNAEYTFYFHANQSDVFRSAIHNAFAKSEK